MKTFVILIALLACVSAGRIPGQDNFSGDNGAQYLTDNRIVGGNAANIEKHPHQVTLRYKNILTPGNAFSHFCGGSIHSERTVITAAHCIISTVPSQWQVVAGTNNRRGNDGSIVPVQEIIMHENYNPDTYNNDIAILVLGTPLSLNNYTVRAIELAQSESREGSVATVTGWGTLKSGGSYPDVLQEVNVPIVSHELCNKDYNGAITDSMICAGYRGVGGKDSCQGDSGGPLISDGKLIGVVSWGRACARPEWPGVYAKIASLRPWLMEKIAAINAQ